LLQTLTVTPSICVPSADVLQRNGGRRRSRYSTWTPSPSPVRAPVRPNGSVVIKQEPITPLLTPPPTSNGLVSLKQAVASLSFDDKTKSASEADPEFAAALQRQRETYFLCVSIFDRGCSARHLVSISNCKGHSWPSFAPNTRPNQVWLEILIRVYHSKVGPLTNVTCLAVFCPVKPIALEPREFTNFGHCQSVCMHNE